MNDLHYCPSTATPNMFADDAYISLSAYLNDLQVGMSSELRVKTEFVVMGSRQKLSAQPSNGIEIKIEGNK